MFCPACHTENRDNAKFCKGCGRLLQPEPAGEETTAVADQASAATSEAVPEESAGSTPPTREVPAPSVEALEAAAPAEAPQEEDPTQAPTLILTPDRMMAYHNRLWQRYDPAHGFPSDKPTAQQLELAREGDQPVSQHISAQDTVVQPVVTMNNTEAELVPPPPPGHPDAQTADEASVPIESIASQATAAEIMPADASGAKIAAPVSLPATGKDGEALLLDAKPEEPSGQLSTTEEQGEKVNENNQSGDQMATDQNAQNIDTPAEVEQTATNRDFPPLEIGAKLQDRYEVMELVNSNEHEHTYHIVDHQGYQHCWNCGSEQNSEEDEFCMDCGAELLGVPYILHEYAATENKEEGSNVLQGTIVNTFVDQGRTYAVEQEQVEQNPFPLGVRLMAATDSDAGDVRRSEPNEDSTLILQLQRVHESRAIPMGVFIVADGMGGHDYGQVASRMAINSIAERMVRELLEVPLQNEKNAETVEPPDEDALVTLLHNAVQDANAQLCQKNQRDKTDMGSTITGFMIVEDRAYILNVGDSRTYMLRGGQLYQLTTDHSLVGQLVAGGLIQPDDVYTHPQRSQIFRSLGDKLNVQIDIFKQQLHPGDILLSCSDGLWEMVRNPAIESILKNAQNPQAACTQLLESANANGGEDNVSAVVVFAQ